MKQSEIIMLLAGTITRGLMWLAAGVSSALGVETLDADTGSSAGYWIASLVIAGAATLWSKFKDRKLLVAEPPK